MCLLARERGWRIQTLFLNQSRDQLARTLVRRGPTDSPQYGPQGTAIMDLLKSQTGWLAELHWDVVINTAVSPKIAGALTTRLIDVARQARERAVAAPQPTRQLFHGASR